MAFKLSRICEIIQISGLKCQEWQPHWTSPEVAPFFLPVKSVSLFFGISLKHISEFNKIEILQFICLLKSLLFDIICLWCTEWNFFRDTVFWLDFWIVDITTSCIWSVDDPNIAKLWIIGGHFAWIGLNQNFYDRFQWNKNQSCVMALHLDE